MMRYYLVALFIGVSIVFASQSAAAATCDSLGGVCTPICSGQTLSNATDCVAPDVCCPNGPSAPPVQAPTAQAPAAAAAPSTSNCPKGATCLQNPFGSRLQATDIIGTIIKAALGVVGSLTLLMMVWGGFQWLTSAGNSEKIEAGSKTMLWAAIGVFLVFSSYLIISTFTNLLTGTN